MLFLRPTPTRGCVLLWSDHFRPRIYRRLTAKWVKVRAIVQPVAYQDRLRHYVRAQLRKGRCNVRFFQRFANELTRFVRRQVPFKVFCDHPIARDRKFTGSCLHVQRFLFHVFRRDARVIFMYLSHSFVAVHRHVPVVVRASRSTRSVQLRDGAISLPTFAGLVSFVTTSTTVMGLQLRDHFPLRRLHDNGRRVTAARLFRHVTAIAVPITATIHSKVSLRRSRAVLFRVGLQDVCKYVFFGDNFYSLQSRRNARPYRHSLFGRISSKVLRK